MISLGDLYKVVAAVAPLYLALVLGYGAVKWWKMFKPEHVDAINRFNYYFISPFFAFDFTSHINPYKLNHKFIFADIISKTIIIVVLLIWANCTRKGNYSWFVTSFSLSSLNNTLVVGVPLLRAMYGQVGADLVVQSFLIQSLLWFTATLFMLELHRVRNSFSTQFDNNKVIDESQGHFSVEVQQNMGSSLEMSKVTPPPPPSPPPPFFYLMKTVTLKLVQNPNVYSCILGITWALIANKWHIDMPIIVEGSILIFSKAGAGAAMFSMGLFMALQENFISCGVSLMLFGLVLRFVVGSLTMAIGAIALGMHGNVLRVAILQAALPQSVTAFVFAKEYKLHAAVLSTAVSFGTILSLPILIAYYTILETLL